MRNVLFALAVIVAATLVLADTAAGQEAAPVAQAGPALETRISWRGSIEGQRRLMWIAFSGDGRHVAYVIKSGDGERAVLDGMELPTHENVAASTLTFSADGKHIAYVAIDNGKAYVVLDGVEGPRYDEVSRPALSADGWHMAYAAVLGEEQFVVYDGVEGPRYDYVGVNSPELRDMYLGKPVLSADGRHLAYAVYDNGDVGKPRAASEEGRNQFVVHDGVEGTRYQGILEDRIIMSRDGKGTGYVVWQDGAFLVVWGEREGPRHDWIEAQTLVTSADGAHMAYCFNEGAEAFASVDWVAGPAYDATGDVVFSRDGGRHAYTATRGEKHFMVVDGKETPGEYTRVRKAVFDASGAHLAYAAKRGDEWTIVRNGEAGGTYAGVRDPVWSSDGRHLAHAAQRGEEWFVVVDGAEGEKRFERIEWISYGGGRVAYTGQRGSKWVVVVNGIETKEFPGEVADGRFRKLKRNLVFDDENELHVLAVSGEELYLVEIRIEQ